MAIKIRPMLSQDKPALMKILKDTPEFKPSETIIAEEVIDSYLGKPTGSGYYVLIAEDGSEIVGYTCYGPTPLTDSTWDIYWQAIAREKQGKGIGTALIKAAEQEIKRSGGDMVIIETSSKPSYENTRRFYLANGYQVIAGIANFYARGDDRVIFKKQLD